MRGKERNKNRESGLHPERRARGLEERHIQKGGLEPLLGSQALRCPLHPGTSHTCPT